jgi:hypothetical protein
MSSNLRLMFAAVTALLFAVGVPLQRTSAEEKNSLDPPAFLTAKPLETSPKQDERQKLLTTLYNNRVAFTLAEYKAFRAGVPSVERLFTAARGLLHTGLELYDNPEQKKTLLAHPHRCTSH